MLAGENGDSDSSRVSALVAGATLTAGLQAKVSQTAMDLARQTSLIRDKPPRKSFGVTLVDTTFDAASEYSPLGSNSAAAAAALAATFDPMSTNPMIPKSQKLRVTGTIASTHDGRAETPVEIAIEFGGMDRAKKSAAYAHPMLRKLAVVLDHVNREMDRLHGDTDKALRCPPGYSPATMRTMDRLARHEVAEYDNKPLPSFLLDAVHTKFRQTFEQFRWADFPEFEIPTQKELEDREKKSAASGRGKRAAATASSTAGGGEPESRYPAPVSGAAEVQDALDTLRADPELSERLLALLATVKACRVPEKTAPGTQIAFNVKCDVHPSYNIQRVSKLHRSVMIEPLAVRDMNRRYDASNPSAGYCNAVAYFGHKYNDGNVTASGLPVTPELEYRRMLDRAQFTILAKDTYHNLFSPADRSSVTIPVMPETEAITYMCKGTPRGSVAMISVPDIRDVLHAEQTDAERAETRKIVTDTLLYKKRLDGTGPGKEIEQIRLNVTARVLSWDAPVIRGALRKNADGTDSRLAIIDVRRLFVANVVLGYYGRPQEDLGFGPTSTDQWVQMAPALVRNMKFIHTGYVNKSESVTIDENIHNASHFADAAQEMDQMFGDYCQHLEEGAAGSGDSRISGVYVFALDDAAQHAAFRRATLAIGNLSAFAGFRLGTKTIVHPANTYIGKAGLPLTPAAAEFILTQQAAAGRLSSAVPAPRPSVGSVPAPRLIANLSYGRQSGERADAAELARDRIAPLLASNQEHPYDFVFVGTIRHGLAADAGADEFMQGKLTPEEYAAVFTPDFMKVQSKASAKREYFQRLGISEDSVVANVTFASIPGEDAFAGFVYAYRRPLASRELANAVRRLEDERRAALAAGVELSQKFTAAAETLRPRPVTVVEEPEVLRLTDGTADVVMDADEQGAGSEEAGGARSPKRKQPDVLRLLGVAPVDSEPKRRKSREARGSATSQPKQLLQGHEDSNMSYLDAYDC